jgi:deazaflavin-dependent oxidoreductase (nitroreductase family)
VPVSLHAKNEILSCVGRKNVTKEYRNPELGNWAKALLDGPPTVLDTSTLHPVEAAAVDSAAGFAAEHARRYIATNGQDDGWEGPGPILLLYTRGRRSGEIRRNPVLFFEHDGMRLVMGSRGGFPKDPAWVLNIQADPNIHVRVFDDFYAATATTLSPEERARVWPELTSRFPVFAEYQERTSRVIPLVRIERKG